MVGGATLTKLIGTSAWYAPGAAASMMVGGHSPRPEEVDPARATSKANTESRTSASAYPPSSAKGVEKIVKVDLTKEESEKVRRFAAAVRKTNNVLHEINAL